MNLHKAKSDIQALREELTAERNIKFDFCFEEGIPNTLDSYVKYRLHLEELNYRLQALDEMETIITDLEAVAQREKQAFEALQAERKKEADKLVDKLRAMDDGPEKSRTLAQIAELLN